MQLKSARHHEFDELLCLSPVRGVGAGSLAVHRGFVLGGIDGCLGEIETNDLVVGMTNPLTIAQRPTRSALRVILSTASSSAVTFK